MHVVFSAHVVVKCKVEESGHLLLRFGHSYRFAGGNTDDWPEFGMKQKMGSCFSARLVSVVMHERKGNHGQDGSPVWEEGESRFLGLSWFLFSPQQMSGPLDSAIFGADDVGCDCLNVDSGVAVERAALQELKLLTQSPTRSLYKTASQEPAPSQLPVLSSTVVACLVSSAPSV